MGQIDESILQLRRSLKIYSELDNQPVYAGVINEIVYLILEWSPDKDELMKKIREINDKNK